MIPSVKICGLREPDMLDAAIAAGADAVGFVFFARSPRHLAIEVAQSLAERARSRVRTVALTVDADDDTLAAVVETIRPDMLQLHGAETPERVCYVRARFGRPVLRALAVSGADDLAAVSAFAAVSDGLLFDARAPAGAERPGGNGISFDWGLLTSLDIRCPWLLAGGLTADNVATALQASGARGVDVSSGVESAPGIKDRDKISRFVAAARSALSRSVPSRPAS